MLRDFISLIYPDICCHCSAPLYQHERHLCLECQTGLPETLFDNDPHNPVEKLFWGRIPVHAATAYLHFTQRGVTQQLLHRLKYKGVTSLGVFLGSRFGKRLADCERFSEADVIIPVPLHRRKLRRRGYNQCHYIARGMASELNIPINTTSLVRTRHSDSQTRKSRFARWQNVETIFDLRDPQALVDKRVLLIDDVVTTGATLEACAQHLLEHGSRSVSIAALAYTNT